jgi:hypothetical protein
MPQFLVLTLEGEDVPALGGTKSAVAYRGDHADEDDAVIAAAAALDVPSGKRLWAVPAGQLTRYMNTTTVTHTVATG